MIWLKGPLINKFSRKLWGVPVPGNLQIPETVVPMYVFKNYRN